MAIPLRDRRSVALLSELSRAGRRATLVPPPEVLDDTSLDELLGSENLDTAPPPLPEVSEPDLVRHYVNLSAQNMSVDSAFYPLGSCTMKYNPKRHEHLVNVSGLRDVHPLQPPETLQGILALLYELQQMLAEISGLPAVSLQPAAGAQGELTCLLIAAAYFRDRNEDRSIVLIPDSAHGTNPASATLAGFRCVTVASNAQGTVDLDDFSAKLSPDVAACMITNPNTLGLFEPEIQTIAERLHEVGALLYIDGANMNAILGKCRPGDFGADMMHFNVHKTFTGPHGAGGPGAGPIAVRADLAPYLPVPVVAAETDDRGRPVYTLDWERPKSVGKVHGFYGNVGILLRGFFYLKTLGQEGLPRVAENAVLNANYLRERIRRAYPVPFGESCMHEFVATTVDDSDLAGTIRYWRRKHLLPRKVDLTAQDVAKRLLDYGFHAPTVYFPLIVPEALMIEPTETECKETLDQFADALLRIREEPAELVREAPHTTPVRRPDEVKAARNPILTWHELNRLEGGADHEAG